MTAAKNLERVIYLPGLNAIRFYAAFSVVVGHTSNNFGDIRTQAGDYPPLNWFLLDPQSAVNLFFVLSGFLITYLLLREQAQAGEISVRRFYMRRILRIWPLYYAILLLCLLVLPLAIGPNYPLYDISWAKRLLLLLLLPNFASALGPLSHLWSIGLEEQFYLTWPWVVRNKTAFLKIALGVVLVKIMITPAILWIGNESITHLFLTLRFECMAIGALGAYLFHARHPILKRVYSLPVKILSLAGFVYLAIFDVPLTEPVILLSSVLFLLLILYVVSEPKIGRILDTPALDQLGKISYGIYLIHYPVIYLAIYALNQLKVAEGPLYTALLYCVVIACTLGLGFLSYYGFERPFLKLKDRFAVIATRSAARRVIVEDTPLS